MFWGRKFIIESKIRHGLAMGYDNKKVSAVVGCLCREVVIPVYMAATASGILY